MKKIVFFGTPHFSKEMFRFLYSEKVPIAAVVTRPDRPKGRSLKMGFSEVKEAVLKIDPNIPLFQPEKASDPDFLEKLEAVKADLFVVVAYGQIVPQKLLDIPPLGCINVHTSLLPKYRGAAPIQRVLMNGEKETGVAIQKMVKQLDAGDLIAVSKISLDDQINAKELEEKLLEVAKPLLLSVLKKFEEKTPQSFPQDHSAATYAHKIELEEGEIHWEKSAEEIHNLIRAFFPRPGAWCWVIVGGEKKRLKILRSQKVPLQGTPGEILSLKEGIIACSTNAIELLEVQPEGKKAMPGSAWLRGNQTPPTFLGAY